MSPCTFRFIIVLIFFVIYFNYPAIQAVHAVHEETMIAAATLKSENCSFTLEAKLTWT